ncbi:hypothetical protein GCL60_12305 [Silvanigrella paludirubra]|uniref:Uncharacterized protein n=1 Tax=Silvanigrella paludirubra TaxID=2499159 RepID=A0A6N6VWX8_9BACT|nr:hypothetical protein [Silvanigrella paludirubra]KAB8037947.1 hypothetical protein GCL60_12305 [Silvanigrella paludirubra]
MIKNLILISIILFFEKSIYADNTYVFCATEERKWEWLKVDNKYVSVSGDWNETEISLKNFHNNKSFYFLYFKIIDNTFNLKQLETECQKKFGNDYIFAQPGNYRFDNNWNLFGSNKDNLGSGFVSYCLTSGNNTCYLGIYNSLIKEFHPKQMNNRPNTRF